MADNGRRQCPACKRWYDCNVEVVKTYENGNKYIDYVLDESVLEQHIKRMHPHLVQLRSLLGLTPAPEGTE